MEHNNQKQAEIASGFDACPSCNGGEWKSARMVVMEGTTNTKGALNGVITDPGAFSGGLKSFLLSDRWFSWDYPIDTAIGLTSMTALVEEIKKLMVAHGSKYRIPPPPSAPQPISPDEKISPIAPDKPPAEPPLPPKPVPPEYKPWYRHFLHFLKVFGIIAVIGGIFFSLFLGPSALAAALVLYLFSMVVLLGGSFSENRRLESEYRKELWRYPSQVEEARRQHRKNCEQYEKDLRTYELQRIIADRQKSEEEATLAAFRKDLDKYEQEKRDVMAAREMLWTLARVCMRCGTAYLSNDCTAPHIHADSPQAEAAR